RTWGGTLLAFRELARTPLPDAGQAGQPSERALAQAANLVISQVAQELGNTPAVCRKSYIDPVLFEGWRDGRLQRAAANARGARQWERAALGFLKREHRRERSPSPALCGYRATLDHPSGENAMAICDVCGNDYDKSFSVKTVDGGGTF